MREYERGDTNECKDKNEQPHSYSIYEACAMNDTLEWMVAGQEGLAQHDPVSDNNKSSPIVHATFRRLFLKQRLLLRVQMLCLYFSVITGKESCDVWQLRSYGATAGL